MSGWGPELSNWVPDVDINGTLNSIGNAMPDVSAVTAPLDEYKAWIFGIGGVLVLGAAAYKNRSSMPNFFSGTGKQTPAPVVTDETPPTTCPFSTSSQPLTTELSDQQEKDAEAEVVLKQGATNPINGGNATKTAETPPTTCPFSTSSQPLATELSDQQEKDAEAEVVFEQGATTPINEGDATNIAETPPVNCSFSTSSQPLTTELSVQKEKDAEAEVILEQAATTSSNEGNVTKTAETPQKPEPTRSKADETFETIGDRVKSGRLHRKCRSR